MSDLYSESFFNFYEIIQAIIHPNIRFILEATKVRNFLIKNFISRVRKTMEVTNKHRGETERFPKQLFAGTSDNG